MGKKLLREIKGHAGVENIDEHILNVVKTANLGMTVDIEASKDNIVNSFDVA